MKKRCSSILLIVLMCFMTVFSSACDVKKKTTLGYEINRENMFGMCAIPNMGYSTSVDPGVEPEIIFDLFESMGVKSARVWMHMPYVVERAKSSNELRLKPKAVADFHAYYKGLKDAGVTNIIAMSHSYIYPVDVLRPSNPGVIPEPGSDEYMSFMQLFEACFKLISAEFPEITKWEPNNETDHPRGASVVRQGFLSTNTPDQNAPFLYTQEDVAIITADMCYYANRGIKANNPDNMLIMPGLVFESSPASAIFIETMYQQIASGKLPSSYDWDGNRVLPADTDTDNYFNALNWHPYANTAPGDAWLDANVDMYNVAKKYGDGGKVLYLSEFGWYDSFDADRQEKIGKWYPQALDMLKEHLPTLESVFMFRMFNYITAGEQVKAMEKTFGIFNSPVEETGIIPKPAALSLFHYFNGADADERPLHKYAKANA